MDFSVIDINLKVYKTKLPDNVHGCISKNKNNSYTILINETDSRTRQEQAFIHECLHIWNDDFNKESVQEIETEVLNHYERF